MTSFHSDLQLIPLFFFVDQKFNDQAKNLVKKLNFVKKIYRVVIKGQYTQKKKFSQYLCFLIKSTILHKSLSNFIHELYHRNFTCTYLLHDK